MVGRLRVLEFMVLKSGGIQLFHYSPSNSKKLGQLLSGFLSAITSFASEFGEKTVQSLSFEGSELLYEQTEKDFIFIFLVESGAPTKLLRAVLRDLSGKFMRRYSSHGQLEVITVEMFEPFESEVKQAFDDYEQLLHITSNLSAFVIPLVDQSALDWSTKSKGFLDEFHRDFGSDGNRILEAIDGKTSIHSLSEKLGLDSDHIAEVVEYLVIWGILQIAKMCPRLTESDSRFDAYLDIIGLPQKDYQLLKRAKSLCTGDRSIIDISNRLNITPERLYEVLSQLGDEVTWNLVDVSGVDNNSLTR